MSQSLRNNTLDPMSQPRIQKMPNFVPLGEREDIKKLVEDWRSTALARFPIQRLGEIGVKASRWLGDHFLEEGTVGALIGASGVGKSFLALDFALSVATGIPWHGRNVVKGPVLYIAGEGRYGILRRARGWAIAHQYQAGLSTIPFYITPGAMNLNDDKSIEASNLAIKATFAMMEPPKLFIIDTWATNLGADENLTTDTMTGIASLVSLTNPYGAAVLIIHHVGHADKHRGRGSSALYAALDMEYLVEKGRDGVIRMRNTKSRDNEPIPPMSFKMQRINLGIENDQGYEEETLVPEIIEHQNFKASIEASGKRQLLALKCLQALAAKHHSELEEIGNSSNDDKVAVREWREAFNLSGGSKQAFYQTKATLIKNNRVIEEGGFAWINQVS